MKDQLGDRIKGFYEDRTRFKLARRTNTILKKLSRKTVFLAIPLALVLISCNKKCECFTIENISLVIDQDGDAIMDWRLSGKNDCNENIFVYDYGSYEYEYPGPPWNYNNTFKETDYAIGDIICDY